ncbi:class I SAM-dependent methyltransferase [Desulfonatronovibrio hydrogenovorans]|uniref:class I SAM-dependent methyltransferase n=1 Tax=Desulfonatronovibrio hydrogenovorans TaxID=53245 RepID=UPI00048F3E4C|nr:methyltransferase domain-containing protein [Desulfonatronovibrio hydrogenovorans]
MFHWEKHAQEYDAWFSTHPGKFALEQEKRLVQHLVSSWPRRKQSLLDIGCGTGAFLELFWESGFDVYGIDASPGMLARAREKMGNRADLHLGKAQHLPFDDNEFDFSAIITLLEFCHEPEKVIREAARVTKKGILLCFLNKKSLYCLGKKMTTRNNTGFFKQARLFSVKEVKKLLFDVLGPRVISARSVLPGPESTWTCPWPLKMVNRLFLPAGIGAFSGMRVDLIERTPLKTPLMAVKKEAGAS